MDTQQIDVMVADASHEVYVDTILETIRNAAAVRGTGIAERTHEYVATKMKEGKAIIALPSFILVATYSCVRSAIPVPRTAAAFLIVSKIVST